MRIFLAVLFLATVCLGAEQEYSPGHIPSVCANRKSLRLSDFMSPHDEIVRQTTNVRTMNGSWYNDTTETYPSLDAMDDHLYEIHKAFMFPGSYYLIEMLRKHVQYLMETGMSSDQMKDYFELQQCDVKELMKNLKEVSNVMYDTEVMALYATRMLIKPILQERMKCPASAVDIGFAKMLMGLQWNLMDSDDNFLYDVFTDFLPKLDPAFQPYIYDIAGQGVTEFHGYIFNKSMELLFTFGMRDVAFSSHTLYGNLVWFFGLDTMTLMSPQEVEKMLMETIQTSLYDVWCPASYEIIENHRKLVMMLKNEFAMIEKEDICSKLAEFLYTYIENNLPWHNSSFENTDSFWMLCDTFKDVIYQVTELFTKYDMFLTSMNIGDVEVLVRKYLSDEDWEMFNEALRRLGFSDTVHVRSIDRISSRWLQKN